MKIAQFTIFSIVSHLLNAWRNTIKWHETSYVCTLWVIRWRSKTKTLAM